MSTDTGPGPWLMRQQVLQAAQVTVFLVQHQQNLLGEIFCNVPRYSRCRVGEDPFAEASQDFASLDGYLRG